jgi:hypothetical protein
MPQIVLGDPSKGAHADFIYALVKMGILSREDVMRTLEFDPEKADVLKV